MSKIISAINITADGFCGYTSAIADEEHHQLSNDLLKSADLVLFGRVTYQLFESFWPLVLNDITQSGSIREFAQRINDVDKIVFSKTLHSVQWNKTRILKGINETSISALKQKPEKNILLFGSPGIVAELTKQELMDDYYFSIQPMITGNGKRLFETIALDKKQNLKLTGTKIFRSGVVTLFYERTR
jgi:dihydrofolate reductase